jgi:hypothetical protein
VNAVPDFEMRDVVEIDDRHEIKVIVNSEL